MVLTKLQLLRLPILALAVTAVLAFSASPAFARITKIVIDTTVAGGTSTTAGPYETLTGRAFGELDPTHPLNAIIQDIELGKDPDGMVRYVVSFRLTKPVDMTKASGLLWHDVPNRGNRVNIPADSRDAGDVQLNSGWQGDNSGNTAVPAYALNAGPFASPVATDWVKVPIAKLPGGGTVTGLVFGRIVNRTGPNSQAIVVQNAPVPYKPNDHVNDPGVLVSRDHETMEGVVSGETVIPTSDWRWARCGNGAPPFPGTPDPTQICLKNGFDGNKLYQVVFTAKDPYVLGVGFAAFRDLAAFLKHETKDDFENANPVSGAMKWSISRGSSQSGNFLRGFLHLGFNQDEAGRQLHDGTWPIIAGRRIALNFRWAQPDGVLELYQAGSEGPQWWHKFPDHTRGLPPNGILVRCQNTGTCPKVIEHFGAAEIWALKLGPEWVGTDPKNDIPLPDNVRRYYIPSTTHGGGNGGFSTTLPATMVNCPGNNFGQGILRANPVPHTQTVTALRFHFRRWVMSGILPPAAQYPTLRGAKNERNLVEPTKAAMGFPTIPVAAVTAGWRTTVPEPGFINPVLDYDWGPNFDASDASGVPENIVPPIKQVIPMLVPRVDADGNELGGVPVVLRDAPLGTYLGWNITFAGFHKDQLCNYVGGMIPFARSKADRSLTGDPRLSLQERYGDHTGYVAAVSAAAAKAVAAGFLLQDDADALIAAAAASNVLNP
jgi:hypothetical protein